MATSTARRRFHQATRRSPVLEKVQVSEPGSAEPRTSSVRSRLARYQRDSSTGSCGPGSRVRRLTRSLDVTIAAIHMKMLPMWRTRSAASHSGHCGTLRPQSVWAAASKERASFSAAGNRAVAFMGKVWHACGLAAGRYFVTRRLPACQSSWTPTWPGSTLKLRSCGRSRRLRLSSAKPGKLARPSTLSHNRTAYRRGGGNMSTSIELLTYYGVAIPQEAEHERAARLRCAGRWSPPGHPGGAGRARGVQLGRDRPAHRAGAAEHDIQSPAGAARGGRSGRAARGPVSLLLARPGRPHAGRADLSPGTARLV